VRLGCDGVALAEGGGYAVALVVLALEEGEISVAGLEAWVVVGGEVPPAAEDVCNASMERRSGIVHVP